jgi:hypothetical protein
LVVTVLSAYDLSSQEQPTSVALNVAGATVRTGPPSARHKDRNSYRFVTSQVLRVNAPLSILYKSDATFTLEYPNPRDNLTASIVCKSVAIHETQWLILNLEPMISTGSMTTTTTTMEDSGEDVEKPTLRLQVRLEGPFRTEIAALVSACNAWFHTVDRATDAVGNVTRSLPNMPSGKFLLLPAVPIATAVVVLSPVLVGVLIVGLPVFLPIVVAVLGALVGVLAVVGVLACSTEHGRKQIGSVCSPMYHTLLSTPSGQCLIYETGPRPTPVSIARACLPTDLWGKLAVSLLIDAVGSASYLIPVVGEVLDVAWAPLQTILIMALYDTVSPNLKYVSFVEEILPLTDVVPSATIGWVTEFGPQLLMLPAHSNNSTTTTNTTSDTKNTSPAAAAMQQVMASFANAQTSNSMNGSNNGGIAATRRSTVSARS